MDWTLQYITRKYKYLLYILMCVSDVPQGRLCVCELDFAFCKVA